MSREEAYHITLDAIAKMQWNVSLILEAKATEAEKVRNWLCTHITNGTYEAHNDQLSTSLQFNEQNVEIIDGLTKLCNGLSRNMKVIINPDSEESDDSMASMFGGMDTGELER
ncbi:restriction endonuclease subunit S [Cohnella cholangitidis]|uniref:Restriction endonuclease subunit S n=1 Tax=Cohnella cholangitidis TaxID=2598458 RepID=A0A7G5BV28_9BACL|nr:restriction endonuclease subunit S [Cohnella cholangitidis]QMV40812.1 restriction endonuclease subunit S [Cohnella cholangitidis]